MKNEIVGSGNDLDEGLEVFGEWIGVCF